MNTVQVLLPLTSMTAAMAERFPKATLLTFEIDSEDFSEEQIIAVALEEAQLRADALVGFAPVEATVVSTGAVLFPVTRDEDDVQIGWEIEFDVMLQDMDI